MNVNNCIKDNKGQTSIISAENTPTVICETPYCDPKVKIKLKENILFKLRSDRVCPNYNTRSAIFFVASDSTFAVNKVIILQHDNLKMHVQYNCHIIVLDIWPRFYTGITIGRQIHSILMNVFKNSKCPSDFQLAISSKESSLVT